MFPLKHPLKNSLVPLTPAVSIDAPVRRTQPQPQPHVPRGLELARNLIGLDLSDERVAALIATEAKYASQRAQEVGVMGYLERPPKFRLHGLL